MRHQETRTLPYSAGQMFGLVADIEKYPEFLPWCKRTRILSRSDNEAVADMIVGTRLFCETFTTHVTFDKPRAIEVRYESGPLTHLSNTWGFASQGRKSCEVSFDVDFDFQSPFLRAAMGMFFDKALRKMVQAFETRACDLFGQTKAPRR